MTTKYPRDIRLRLRNEVYRQQWRFRERPERTKPGVSHNLIVRSAIGLAYRENPYSRLTMQGKPSSNDNRQKSPKMDKKMEILEKIVGGCLALQRIRRPRPKNGKSCRVSNRGTNTPRRSCALIIDLTTRQPWRRWPAMDECVAKPGVSHSFRATQFKHILRPKDLRREIRCTPRCNQSVRGLG